MDGCMLHLAKHHAVLMTGLPENNPTFGTSKEDYILHCRLNMYKSCSPRHLCVHCIPYPGEIYHHTPLLEKRQYKSVHFHHLRNRDPRPTLLQNPAIGMTALVPINRPLGIKPISRRSGLLNSIVTSAAAAGRSWRPVAALAGPLSGAAVVPADEEGVDGTHGGKAGADDADGVLDDGPDDGVDVGPCEC